ncbi:MAG: acetoin dehydrogenase [Elusimicrobia bacterium]|nr:MAG: acetoin dehydrogenase [Elusimicrobiota bacterium]
MPETLTTRAAILREIGKPLTIETLTLPELKPGQALVKMKLAGVCHSQRIEASGGRGPDRFLPHLMGHEGVGEVLAVGSENSKVAVGDQVVLSWLRGSGVDGGGVHYTIGDEVVNAGPIATFCDTPIVSEVCITKIDSSVEAAAAVLAGCALPTGAGTVWNAAPAQKDGSVCIIGAGGVGLAALSGAVQAGWGTIVGVDVKPMRLDRAKEIGATHVIDASREDVAEAAKKITDGSGFDLVLECAGTQKTMESAIPLAGRRGTVVIVGNLAKGKKIQVDPFDLIAGRTLRGSWGGWINPDQDIERFVRMSVEGELPYQPLLGKRFSLDRVNEALDALLGDEPGRPLIEF